MERRLAQRVHPKPSLPSAGRSSEPHGFHAAELERFIWTHANIAISRGTRKAGAAGGTVLLGVEDGSRHVRGVADPLAIEERLANLISDSITPRMLPDLEILTYRKTHVVAVQVFPSPTRPHYLTRSGLHGGAYVRVGSTNRRADDALISEMQRFARGEAFDERAMPELDSEAIDFRVASELFAPVRKLVRRDLDTLRLVTSHQGRKVPTVGGMILFGPDHDPRPCRTPRADGPGDRVRDRVCREAFHPRCRDRPPSPHRALVVAAGRRARGGRQRRGPCRLFTGRGTVASGSVRRPDGGGEPRAATFWSDRR